MKSYTKALILSLGLLTIGLDICELQVAYAWPPGTTGADKDRILSARTMDDLTLEHFGIAEENVRFFDAYIPDTPEYQDLLDCGFVEKNGWEILQCLEDKGHPVRRLPYQVLRQ